MGLFSAAKALLTSDGIIEKGSAAIDALHLSKEEEADLNIKLIEAKAKLLDSSSASAITRRILAVSISAYWLFCGTLWALLWLFLFFSEGDITRLDALTNHIDENVNPAFLLVNAFYFGVRALGSFKK